MSRGDILVQCIKAFESAGIRTCILHGYETYPDYIPSDVDFVVAPRDLMRIPPILKQIEQATGARLVQAIQHEITSYAFILSCSDPAGGLAFLQLDAASDYRCIGRIFFRAHEFLHSRRRFGPFWVSAPDLEFGYYLVKKVAKGSLEQKHAIYLSRLYHKDPRGCQQQAYRLWPKDSAKKIIQAASSHDWTDVMANLPIMRRRLLQKIALINPLGVLIYWCGEVVRWFKRWVLPTGLLVAFLGPDGSGKSTIIPRVKRDLLPAFHRAFYKHLRPYLLGAININKDVGPVTNPHGKQTYSKFASILKLLYLLVDYTLGYQLRVRPKLVRKTLVLFDRYYYDLLVDPRRYRYGGPVWLARLVARFIPRPDLVILLDAPPEVLQKRKQEVSFEETARQREAYLRLMQNMPNGYVVDASKPLDEVIAEVQRIILNYMAERTARRLGLKG